jgi:hypothetical protein
VLDARASLKREEDLVIALATICSSTGHEVLAVLVEDYDPYVTLIVRHFRLELTRTESRLVADALRAASLRRPYDETA